MQLERYCAAPRSLGFAVIAQHRLGTLCAARHGCLAPSSKAFAIKKPLQPICSLGPRPTGTVASTARSLGRARAVAGNTDANSANEREEEPDNRRQRKGAQDATAKPLLDRIQAEVAASASTWRDEKDVRRFNKYFRYLLEEVSGRVQHMACAHLPTGVPVSLPHTANGVTLQGLRSPPCPSWCLLFVTQAHAQVHLLLHCTLSTVLAVAMKNTPRLPLPPDRPRQQGPPHSKQAPRGVGPFMRNSLAQDPSTPQRRAILHDLAVHFLPLVDSLRSAKQCAAALEACAVLSYGWGDKPGDEVPLAEALLQRMSTAARYLLDEPLCHEYLWGSLVHMPRTAAVRHAHTLAQLAC